MLAGKNVILGVTGGIAAYKSAFLCRLLVKAGAHVKVVMTPDAKSFVTPLTLSTLSKHPVYWEYFDEDSGAWTNHVELGKWADLMVIAPLTANSMAKMAQGVCDNLLLAVYLSADCPVYFAPAMDLDMFQHGSTKANIDQLTAFGNILIAPDSGELASGLKGEGRMREPEEIVAILEEVEGSLQGKQVLISAGPTYEAIDPVRFIGNRSSGKMGYAIAEEAIRRGAKVHLVSGPTAMDRPKGASFEAVETAAEMKKAMDTALPKADIIIMSAAVADYRPKNIATQKMKKQSDALSLELEPTDDILAGLGKAKKASQLLVGFALETNDAETHAKGKLIRKGLDMIVLNSLADEGAGFGHTTNKISIFDKDNNTEHYELKSKAEVAVDLWNYIETYV